MKLKPWPKLQETLPDLAKWEKRELKQSIQNDGVLQPVLCLPDGRIIDGYHRLKYSDKTPPYEILNISEEAAFALGLTLNSARRNLSLEQYRELKKKEKNLALELRKSGKTQLETSRILGISQQTISSWESGTNTKIGISPIPDLRRVIPQNEVEKICERIKTGETQESIAADYKVTRSAIGKLIQREEKRRKMRERVPPEMIEGKYNVILADPPWHYSCSFGQGIAQNHYPTMETSEIKQLEVPADDNSVLYLWATAPKLEAALEVMKAWGFEYRTCAVWDKELMGIGFWFRGQHELLLVGVKGEFSPPKQSARVSSVIHEKRTEHSKKPEIVNELLEKWYPNANFLELFARRKRKGWTVWGDEIDN